MMMLRMRMTMMLLQWSPSLPCSHLASHASKDAEEQTRHLFQRLSLVLIRGNAALTLNRTPAHADAEVDGDQDFDS